MSWVRRTPKRRPHPDPARELDLLRILDLRASIDRRADLIRQYRREIGNLHREALRDGNKGRIELFLREAKVLNDRITATEEAIAATGEQIAALQSKIPADDLAFL